MGPPEEDPGGRKPFPYRR